MPDLMNTVLLIANLNEARISRTAWKTAQLSLFDWLACGIAGVECARLAQLGMTSCGDGLMGAQGFVPTHSTEPNTGFAPADQFLLAMSAINSTPAATVPTR